MFGAELAWIPAFAGMTELRRSGASAEHPLRCIFNGGTKDMKVRKIKFPDFVLFVPSW